MHGARLAAGAGMRYALLSGRQVNAYVRLRGYDGTAREHKGHH